MSASRRIRSTCRSFRSRYAILSCRLHCWMDKAWMGSNWYFYIELLSSEFGRVGGGLVALWTSSWQRILAEYCLFLRRRVSLACCISVVILKLTCLEICSAKTSWQLYCKCRLRGCAYTHSLGRSRAGDGDSFSNASDKKHRMSFSFFISTDTAKVRPTAIRPYYPVLY